MDLSILKRNLKTIKKQFQQAEPYPHVIIENFLKRPMAEKLLREFPSVEDMRASSAFSGVAEKKSQLSDIEKMPKLFQGVFKDLMSSEFRSFVSQISGIKPVLPDPDLTGGGLHQGGDGSFLDIHADFNKHPKTGKYRRLNILIYLNKNWKESYGGYLEIWDKDMKSCVKSVAPVFNRCLIFATDKQSHHGYPVMHLPPGVTRKSMAAYYYSDQPAVGEDMEYHTTLFKARPGEFKSALYMLLSSKLVQRLRTWLKNLA